MRERERDVEQLRAIFREKERERERERERRCGEMNIKRENVITRKRDGKTKIWSESENVCESVWQR